MKALAAALLLASILTACVEPGVRRVPSPQAARSAALADLFVGGPYLTAPPAFQVQTVRAAQRNLQTLGFYRGTTAGTPNPALNEALRAYQTDHRFRATGRLDQTTLQALDLLTLPPEM